MSIQTTQSYFGAHVKEIRLRSGYCFFSWCITFVCSYFFKEQCIYCLAKPIGGGGPQSPELEFFCTHITEAFYASLECCLVVTSYFLIPFFFYQFWAFMGPGQYKQEHLVANRALTFFSLCAFCIPLLLMAYAIPYIYQFFYSFSITWELLEIRLQGRIATYLSWLLHTGAIFFTFLLIAPLVYILLEKNMISISHYSGNRLKGAVVILAVGAALSPPDLVSQLIIATAFLCFLEILIYLYLWKRLPLFCVKFTRY